MSLSLYNTRTRSVEEFQPLDPRAVRVYGCGPTIYSNAHIGNFRSFVAYDILHRYLKWVGYEVRFVMNLTDVDDKTIGGAVEKGVPLTEYTAPFGESFLDDSRALGILPASSYPRATEYVAAMVEWIRRLEEKGLAYTDEDGSVYYKISGFENYGELKGLEPDSVMAGARVAVDEYDKEDARDFALWKAAKPVDEEVGAAWDSPWGRGRPGWHLECSVMSIAELGETIDIHLGGEDLVFPHHENEIAQSEGVTGKPFVRFWVHVKHLLVEGQKMSKSLGNFIVFRELLDSGVEAAAVRHQLISAHHRRELNFTQEGLKASAQAIQRMVDFQTRIESMDGGGDTEGPISEAAREAIGGFQAAMDDDLNTPEALAALFMFVTRSNAELDAAGHITEPDRSAALDALESMDRVFGILELARESRSVDAETEAWVEALVAERIEARANRDFARSDAIRDELAEKGIVLEDSASGTRWKVTR